MSATLSDILTWGAEWAWLIVPALGLAGGAALAPQLALKVLRSLSTPVRAPAWLLLLAFVGGGLGGWFTGQFVVKAAFAIEKAKIVEDVQKAERKAASATEIALRQRIDTAEDLKKTAEEQRSQALEALRATQANEARYAAQVRASRAAADAAQRQLESIRDDTAAASFDPSYRIVGPDRIGTLNRVLCFDTAGRARKGRDPACNRYRATDSGSAP